MRHEGGIRKHARAEENVIIIDEHGKPITKPRKNKHIVQHAE